MATAPTPSGTATTEQALRDRIHRLFDGDGVPVHPQTPPPFWVGPTDEQRNTAALEIHEGIQLGDQITVRSDDRSCEREWLEAPRVELGGKCPEAMLTGSHVSRQRLSAFVAAIEASLRHGSFS